MAQRTCGVEGCERPHSARGLCPLHWKRRRKAETGRSHHPMHKRTCVTCGSEWETPRPEARFCTAKCKGVHLRRLNQRKCRLPVDHPVMLLIAEARRPKPEPPRVDKRTARECPGCACWFSPLHHSAWSMRYCSEPCARRVQKRRYRARKSGAQGEWTWGEFMRIARKFNYCCAYCGEKPERLDADHVVPLSRGGSDSTTNLLPTCAMCNSSKCAMTLAEWAVWLAERGQPPRVTTWQVGDSRYVHLTDALLGISPAA